MRPRCRPLHRAWLLPCLLAGIATGLASPTQASLDAEAAEALAKAQWFEGIPDDRIDELSPEAILRLKSLLEDPGSSPLHAGIIEVLGRAGGSGAFEVIEEFASQAPEGEVDEARFRARLAIPLAWGYLARSDDRALARLRRDIADDPRRRWRHRRMNEGRIRRLMRMSTLTGLALSGRPESRAILERLAQRGQEGEQQARGHGQDARGRDGQAGQEPRDPRDEDAVRDHAADMIRVHERARAQVQE
jgi:hypothetical protein